MSFVIKILAVMAAVIAGIFSIVFVVVGLGPLLLCAALLYGLIFVLRLNKKPDEKI